MGIKKKKLSQGDNARIQIFYQDSTTGGMEGIGVRETEKMDTPREYILEILGG